MSVQAVGASVTSPQPQRQAGGKGKAWASAALPGLGQFLDGRNTAGAAYLGSSIAILIARCFFAKKKGYEMLAQAFPFAQLGLWITNIVDARRGGFNNK